MIGKTEATEVERILGDIEQKLLPLLERCQRVMKFWIGFKFGAMGEKAQISASALRGK